MTISKLLITGATALKEAGIDNAAKEVELFLSHILQVKRLDLYLNSNNQVTGNNISLFNSFIARRIKREPVAYITGFQDFMELSFKVNRNVLIPRPETELLAEHTLALIDKKVPGYEILDLATGSGILAITLKKKFPFVRMTASDISAGALAVAKENAKKHGVFAEITFLESNMFKGLKKGKKFHLIVSNPPYVPKEDMKILMEDVRLFEPKTALDGGKEGLRFYKEVIKKAPLYLHSSGYLALEIGFGQAEKIRNLFNESGKFDILKLVRDYAAIERVLIARVKNG